MFADLHLHTCFSDGTYTPEELTAQARRHALATIAVTDHDTVEACPRMAAACEREGINFIPGTELTSELHGTEFHLLGYFLNVEHPALLSAMLSFQEVRKNRIREMVARLKQLNIPIEEEAVFSIAQCNSPGRPHVGRALVQAGVCRTLDEAFERFLKKNKPAWVPKFKISAADAIRLIHDAGGLAVLAHPGINRGEELLPELVTAGLDGVECFHTKHSHSQSAHFVGLAEKYRLLITGGSDCHGMNKGQPLIGSVKLPQPYIQAMRDKWRERHPASLANHSSAN